FLSSNLSSHTDLHLNFDKNQVSQQDVSNLATAFMRCTNLSVLQLDLSSAKNCSDILQELGPYLPLCKHLKCFNLYLRQGFINSRKGIVLPQLTSLSVLVLDLTSCKINCQIISQIGNSLQKYSNLQTLSLYLVDNDIRDEGIQNLTYSLKDLPKLYKLTLSISHNNIISKGLSDFSQAISKSSNYKKMNNQIQADIIIMKNILYLVSISKKTFESQRNLLNKWFQDSIKNYILEQVASSLIAKHLNCHTSDQVKNIIRQNLDKSKPKYMGIIEQYFLLINKYNQRVAFIEKLNQIIQNPQDITHTLQAKQKSYNTHKRARKQFVCFLILRLFESDQLGVFPSFYEIWNQCFPNEIQTKKKLSKFDKKETNQRQKRAYRRKLTQKESFPNSENDFNNSKFTINLKQESSLPAQSIQDINNFDQSQVKLSESTMGFISQKQQINNKIFEDDGDEEEYVINQDNNQFDSKLIYKEEDNINIKYQYQQEIQSQYYMCETQQYQMYYQEQYQLQQQLKGEEEEEYYYYQQIL
ncbi:hypothetical protein ABPG73_008923, partial [Tetrahymena malaccensis]